MPWKMSYPFPFVQKLCYLTMTSWQIPLHRMLFTTTCYFLRQSKKHYFFRDLDYKIIKRATAENIAGSGLNLMQLYKNNFNEIVRWVTCNFYTKGSRRFTKGNKCKKKKVVDDVIPKLALYFENELSV